MPGRMAGRVALVTGGGGGIGEATGRLFAEEGAAVTLLDTDGASVAAAAAGIQAAVPGAQVLALTGDLTRESASTRRSRTRTRRTGSASSVVNVLGAASCCKAALPWLRATGRGSIVNVSSVYGVMGRTGMGQYDTTKAAVLGFTRALAVEEMRTQRAGDNLLGRWAEPREVAYPILFLASDESSFVTGATLMVDAGRSIL
jgi:2-hydroxycyclohexanecarboxyl-CoA dehydrogenase